MLILLDIFTIQYSISIVTQYHHHHGHALDWTEARVISPSSISIVLDLGHVTCWAESIDVKSIPEQIKKRLKTLKKSKNKKCLKTLNKKR